jgi:hypothetical protein
LLSINRLHICFIVFVLLIVFDANAQITIGDNFKISGNTSTQYTYYNTQNINGGNGFPQRPTHYPQFMGRLSLQYKSLSIPVDLSLNPTLQFSGVINTPMEGPRSLNIFEYLAHPTNRIYLNPTYKSFKIHLGHFINPYSRLSSGDMKIFGLGADYTRGNNTFRFQRGIIQPRVANVDFNFNNGTFRRNLTAAQFKRKLDNKKTVGVNLSLASDNINSLDTLPLFNLPQKTATVSFTGSYKLKKHTLITGEIANSSWASNALLKDTLREFGLLNFAIPNTSVRNGLGFDFRARTTLDDIKINSFIGYKTRNFRSLAYPFMQTDLLELEVNPTGVFLDKKLQADVYLGYKGSNISKFTGRSLNIPIFKLSSLYKFSQSLSLTTVYSFNSVSSSGDISLGEINSRNQVFRVLPTYSFTSNGLTHRISLIAGLSGYNNRSSSLTMPLKTTNQTGGIVYQGRFKKHSFGASLNSINTRVNAAGVLRYTTLTFNGRTQLLDSKLNPFTRISLTRTSTPAGGIGGKRVIQVGSSYKATKKARAHLGISYQYFKQGRGANAPGFREILVRTGINYRL